MKEVVTCSSSGKQTYEHRYQTTDVCDCDMNKRQHNSTTSPQAQARRRPSHHLHLHRAHYLYHRFVLQALQERGP